MDIFVILRDFRQHPNTLIADVRQMYVQILIEPQHRTYQRILWRPLRDKPIQEFCLNTYGVSSSAYLA